MQRQLNTSFFLPLQQALCQRVTYLLMITAIAITACGGSADPVPVAPSEQANGAFKGTFGESAEFNFFVLPNDKAYGFIGTSDSNGFLQATSFFEATGTINKSSFTSQDLVRYQFGREGVQGTLNASFKQRTSFDGVVTTTERAAFSATAMPMSELNFDRPSFLVPITGRWSGSFFNVESFDIEISPTGTITGKTVFGCQFFGIVSTINPLKALFEIFLIFGTTPCFQAGQTLNGVGVLKTLIDGRTQLLFGISKPDKSAGLAGYALR